MDVSVDLPGIVVEGVERLHGDDDDHDQREDDERVDGLEDEAEGFVPSEVRMGCADDPLGEDDVDDEQ